MVLIKITQFTFARKSGIKVNLFLKQSMANRRINEILTKMFII